MRIIFSAAFALLAYAAVSAQATPADTAIASAGKDERYRIGLQDVLSVQIDRFPDLTQANVPVQPDGTIELFRLEKRITAICKTEEELARDIRSAYMENYLRNPQVRVKAEQRSQPIYLIGAVDKPGTYLVGRKYTLLEILAGAGGATKDAGTRMVVVRGGSPWACKDGKGGSDDSISTFNFKLRDILEGKTHFWMQPGDIVTLSSADIIYVYGNVNKQGSYPVQERITLRQAIALAEGAKPAAKTDKIRLIRQKPGTDEHEEKIYNLGDIEKGKVADPFLEPNDIVAVSEDRTKAILHGIGNALKSSVPSAIYRIP